MDRDLAIAKLGGADLELVGARVRCTRFSGRHLESPDYLGWLNDHEVVRTLNLPSYWRGVAFATVRTYCENLMASSTDLFLAVHDLTDGAFVGTAKAGHISWHASTADIGIMIGRKDRWGRGLGRDAVSTLCHHLFEEVRLRKLTAGAMAVNPAIIRLFETLGFHREAVLREQDLTEGGFCDHLLFGAFRHEFRPSHCNR
jgi:[ribosomal protein S5]-alanine N-acetyltransferase